MEPFLLVSRFHWHYLFLIGCNFRKKKFLLVDFFPTAITAFYKWCSFECGSYLCLVVHIFWHIFTCRFVANLGLHLFFGHEFLWWDQFSWWNFSFTIPPFWRLCASSPRLALDLDACSYLRLAMIALFMAMTLWKDSTTPHRPACTLATTPLASTQYTHVSTLSRTPIYPLKTVPLVFFFFWLLWGIISGWLNSSLLLGNDQWLVWCFSMVVYAILAVIVWSHGITLEIFLLYGHNGYCSLMSTPMSAGPLPHLEILRSPLLRLQGFCNFMLSTLRTFSKTLSIFAHVVIDIQLAVWWTFFGTSFVQTNQF